MNEKFIFTQFVHYLFLHTTPLDTTSPNYLSSSPTFLYLFLNLASPPSTSLFFLHHHHTPYPIISFSTHLASFLFLHPPTVPISFSPPQTTSLPFSYPLQFFRYLP